MRFGLATAIAFVLGGGGHLLPNAVSSPQAKKAEPGKDVVAQDSVEPINPLGEPKPLAYKAIAGPKVCLGFYEGEWVVQLRPGDVDWMPIDGWIEVDGGELTKVTGFANLETGPSGKKDAHTDRGKFNKKRIDFDLWVKSGGLDTFRFATSEETRSIRFRFRIGRRLASGDRVLIGKEGRHPSQGEFSLVARPDGPGGKVKFPGEAKTKAVLKAK